MRCCLQLCLKALLCGVTSNLQVALADLPYRENLTYAQVAHLKFFYLWKLRFSIKNEVFHGSVPCAFALDYYIADIPKKQNLFPIHTKYSAALYVHNLRFDLTQSLKMFSRI
ncbi:MAG: hypothetical protein LBF12_03090 [Christensenellaceae bacterium]|jgi:hypothetical protein|nr:hypothetical protein [Christensenellaceae bacterium]